MLPSRYSAIHVDIASSKYVDVAITFESELIPIPHRFNYHQWSSKRSSSRSTVQLYDLSTINCSSSRPWYRSSFFSSAANMSSSASLVLGHANGHKELPCRVGRLQRCISIMPRMKCLCPYSASAMIGYAYSVKHLYLNMPWASTSFRVHFARSLHPNSALAMIGQAPL